MEIRKYRPGQPGRKIEQPGEAPYTQTLMLALHQAVIEENRRQKANEYSLRDERGKTFSLTYWSPFQRTEVVLIPAGTPINEKNLTWAVAELEKEMSGMQFGRWSGEDREQSMARLRAFMEAKTEERRVRDED